MERATFSNMEGATFSNLEGARILDRMIDAIAENKQYLSDIDGAIGDGDHGINMNKGFQMAREALGSEPGDFSHGLLTLSKVLIMRIGGSMGPLYGKVFRTLGKTLQGHDQIDSTLFGEGLTAAREAVRTISPAQPGDKTLVDSLFPAVDAYLESAGGEGGFGDALQAMKEAAEAGRDATREMVAKLGRSSRLGERSRGVIDAGAASCALLLGVMADTIRELLKTKARQS